MKVMSASYRKAIKSGLNETQAINYESYVRRKTRLPTRDSERQKTYNAEFAFESEFPHVRERMEFKECEQFVKRVLKSKLWAQFVNDDMNMRRINKAYRNVSLCEFKSRSWSGMCFGNVIKLDSHTGTNKYVILHELAHSAGFSKHDYRFRWALLKLVSRFLGQAEAKGLKKIFREHKLRYTPPTVKDPQAWLKAARRAPGAIEPIPYYEQIEGEQKCL